MDKANQQQDLAELSRDIEHANQTLSPIFNKEKEQRRLTTAQLLGEVGNQVMDIARTQGKIQAIKAGQEALARQGVNQPDSNASPEQKADYQKRLIASSAYQQTQAKYGTGSQLQRAMQAATLALQGLAGSDLKAAIAAGSSPYLADIIKNNTPNDGARVIAHAVVNAVLAKSQGHSAAAGAVGAAVGEMTGILASNIYQKPADQLSEEQKQTISALATLASGLSGAIIGNGAADTVAAAQAGKTTVENNSLANVLAAAEANKKGTIKQYEHSKQVYCELMPDACKQAARMIADGVDFIPVAGTIKGIAEAQGAIDYLTAAMAIIPGAGQAGKIVKAAETALKKGDVAQASKLINKASNEVSARIHSSKLNSGAENVATYPKLKNQLNQQNLNHIAKQDPRLAVAIKGDGTGKVDFGIGSGSRAEADRLGKIWVGEGAKPTSGGGWISADGTRQYRPPVAKPNAPKQFNPTGSQANFESFELNSIGQKIKVSNGHLIVKD